MAIKTAAELAAMCKKVATEYKTLYVMGCFGAPMTASNKERYTQNHSYNRQTTRTVMIKSATSDTFGFDCVCLIKAILWGWSGNKSHVYGGSVYGSNGVPDINTEQIIAKCKDVSTDFSRLQIGELLWMQGHVGIYIGGGKAVESTPAWKNGVQVTDVLNVKAGTGHRWVKHGKLPYVTYAEAADEAPASTSTPVKNEVKAEPKTLPTLSLGNTGDMVRVLQYLLKYNGYDCGAVDGDYGGNTKKAVTKLQHDNNIKPEDGICGPMTWPLLTKVP